MTLPLNAVPWAFAATASPEPFNLPDVLAGTGSFPSPDAVVKYVRSFMWPQFETERTRLRLIDLWYRGEQANPNVPHGATRELLNLLALSKTPWLGLVVTTIAQAMYADGYRSPEMAKNTPGPWRTWNANSFDVRQIAVHRAALAYGYAYTTVLPGLAPDGTKCSVLRGVSPQRMFAVYEDPGADDWPVYAMKVEPERGGKCELKVFDDTFVHTLTRTEEKVEYIGTEAHSAGVCPVIRYCNQLDLDGRTPGEVEPFVPVASRIDKTEFDRLMVQHYNSWKVRYISGMANFAESEDEANLKRFKLRQSDILVSEDPDTKFGQLDETNLAGFISSAEADIEALAAVAQLPNHLLTGKMINLPLALDTKVPVPGGFSTMGDLRVGDEVFGLHGRPAGVTALSPVYTDRECYKLTFDSGVEVVADADHGWTTTHFTYPASPYSKAKGREQRTTSMVTTRDIAETLRTRVGTFNHFIPVYSPHDGPEIDFGVDPYTLGAWLGDGDRINGIITAHDDDATSMVAALEGAGELVMVRKCKDEAHKALSLITITYDKLRCPYGHGRPRGTKYDTTRCTPCRKDRESGVERVKVNLSFPARLKELGVWRNKHIPEQYFHGSLKQRLSLLQGIMDTDGTVKRGQGSVAFTTHDHKFADQVRRLVRSLGYKAEAHAAITGPRPTPSGGYTPPCTSFRITFSALDVVFRMPRKAELQRTDFGGGDGKSNTPRRHYIVGCERVESVPVRCITVDSEDHLFCVTDAFIATHNSAEALAAARAPLTQKVFERQTAFGASHSQMLRLSAKLEGDLDAANDPFARITWQDVEVRSLAQAADAYGKLAQMLGVPRQFLWPRIPGVTQSDVQEWTDHALDDDPLSKYLRGLSDIRATPAGGALIGADQQLGANTPLVPPPAIPGTKP